MVVMSSRKREGRRCRNDLDFVKGGDGGRCSVRKVSTELAPTENVDSEDGDEDEDEDNEDDSSRSAASSSYSHESA